MSLEILGENASSVRRSMDMMIEDDGRRKCTAHHAIASELGDSEVDSSSGHLQKLEVPAKYSKVAAPRNLKLSSITCVES